MIKNLSIVPACIDSCYVYRLMKLSRLLLHCENVRILTFSRIEIYMFDFFSEYEHIIEIYDFPVDFVTRDLITAFQAFM